MGEGLAMLMEAELKEAQNKGRDEERVRFVLNLHKNNVDFFTICKCVNLTDCEVGDILRNHEKELKDIDDPTVSNDGI